jgi:hypothetical protein
MLLSTVTTLLAQNKTARTVKKPDTARGNPYNADTLFSPIPFNRQYLHDKIDKELKKAYFFLNNYAASKLHADDTALFNEFAVSVRKGLPSLKRMIENMPVAGGRDSLMATQEKIRALNALSDLVKTLNAEDRPDFEYYINLIANFKGLVIADNENTVMQFARINPTIYTLDNGKKFFDNNPGFKEYIYLHMAAADNKSIIRRLPEFTMDSFAGTIIAEAARTEPELIFNYVTSTNAALINAIRRTRDSLVQAIVNIADFSKAPLKVLPFLGSVSSGKATIAEMDSIAADPDSYYHSLVELNSEHPPVAEHIYKKELNYRGLLYIRKINELHEAHDAERFQCLEHLSTADLYYLLINGENEIYTSSYIGTFKRLMQRMKPLRGDQLLDTLHYDRFRTFIKLCAGYNTLSDFLKSMPDTAKTLLLKKFIAGLQYEALAQDGANDKNEKGNNLEAAVEVADALGSIRDSALLVLLEKNIKMNYEQCYTENSRRGMIIYSLLSRLVEGSRVSGNDEGAAAASERLRLPPINKTLFADLANGSGIVYEQVYFFGDEDGEKSYAGFIANFKNDTRWEVETNNYWATISSKTGKKIVIYANLPLKEPADEEAQTLLCRYLADSGIHPTVVIHRGHSYHLPHTVSQLNKYVKVVILGSCGGYHNLASVLARAPDAQIVSSKQTGVMAVNEPIITELENKLLHGEDVNWIALWNKLEASFQTKPDLKEKFDDYIPPHKNLGALFIKAYARIMAILQKQ